MRLSEKHLEVREFVGRCDLPLSWSATAWSMATTNWPLSRTADQIDAMIRDLAPVEAILGQIRRAAEQRRQGRMP